MKHLARLVFASALGVGLATSPASSADRKCFVTGDCPATQMCIQHFSTLGQFTFRGEPRCETVICNSDAECGTSTASRICLRGFCQSPNTPPARPSRPPPPQPGPQAEGAACGQVKFGQVTKTVGCLKPFVCVKAGRARSGTCRLAI
jgi:hypothetical protein